MVYLFFIVAFDFTTNQLKIHNSAFIFDLMFWNEMDHISIAKEESEILF